MRVDRRRGCRRRHLPTRAGELIAALEERVRALEHELTVAQTERDVYRELVSDAGRGEGREPLLHLTRTQHKVLQLVLRGWSNKQIARRLGVAEGTAKFHVKGIADRLGTRRRAEIVLKTLPLVRAMNDVEYEALTGISKDWWRYAE